jgi:hypothetical protein
MFSQREKQATDENAGVIAILEHLTFLIMRSQRGNSCNATQIHGQQFDLFVLTLCTYILHACIEAVKFKNMLLCDEVFSFYVAVKLNFQEDVLLYYIFSLNLWGRERATKGRTFWPPQRH